MQKCEKIDLSRNPILRREFQDEKLHKTIVILITDFKIKKLKELGYYTKWQIMEANCKMVLTENLEIYIMELPKIDGRENEKDKLLDWLCFLENPKSERVARNMGENKELKDAIKELNRISEDEKMQRIAELREKAIMDEKAIYRKGLKDGKEEGELKQKKEIAKKLIEKGLAIDEMLEITGLTKKEI